MCYLMKCADVWGLSLQVKQNKEIMDEGLKQEGLLARDFEFALYKKVTLYTFESGWH